MSAIKTIAERYDAWWKVIGTRITNPVQIEECRRAFYSGCFSQFNHLMELSELPDDMSEKGMGAIQSELEVYFNSLGQTYDPKTGRS